MAPDLPTRAPQAELPDVPMAGPSSRAAGGVADAQLDSVARKNGLSVGGTFMFKTLVGAGIATGVAVVLAKRFGGDTPDLGECTQVCRESFPQDGLDSREDQERRAELLQKCLSACVEASSSGSSDPLEEAADKMTDTFIKIATKMLSVFGPLIVVILVVKFAYSRVSGAASS